MEVALEDSRPCYAFQVESPSIEQSRAMEEAFLDKHGLGRLSSLVAVKEVKCMNRLLLPPTTHT